MASEADLLALLARRAAFLLARVVGLVLALFVAGATLFLWFKGGPDAGQNLQLLRHYLPGFRISPLGALIGGAETWLLAVLLTLAPAWVYFRGVLAAIRTDVPRLEKNLDPRDAMARLHPGWFGAAGGLFAALLLFVATIWLVWKHQPGEVLGPHLGLIGHYLPGYDVSIRGAFIGAGWGLLFAGLFFAVVAWLHDRLLLRRGRS